MDECEKSSQNHSGEWVYGFMTFFLEWMGSFFIRGTEISVVNPVLGCVNTFDVLSDFIDRCIFTLDCCKPRSLQFLYFFDLFQCLLSYRTIQKAIFELCFKLRNLTLPKNVMWILIP